MMGTWCQVDMLQIGTLNRSVKKIELCLVVPPELTAVSGDTYFGSTRGMSICIRVKA